MSSAAAPATWGVAMLVPEMVLVAASEVAHADVMPVPGANKSTQDPKLEYPARLSLESDAATVMAAPSRITSCHVTAHHYRHRDHTASTIVQS